MACQNHPEIERASTVEKTSMVWLARACPREPLADCDWTGDGCGSLHLENGTLRFGVDSLVLRFGVTERQVVGQGLLMEA